MENFIMANTMVKVEAVCNRYNLIKFLLNKVEHDLFLVFKTDVV